MKLNPNEQHLKLINAWKKSIGEEGAGLQVDEIVALLSQLLGNCIALLDHRKYTPVIAMRLVEENIVIGNEAVLESLMKPEGKA